MNLWAFCGILQLRRKYSIKTLNLYITIYSPGYLRILHPQDQWEIWPRNNNTIKITKWWSQCVIVYYEKINYTSHGIYVWQIGQFEEVLSIICSFMFIDTQIFSNGHTHVGQEILIVNFWMLAIIILNTALLDYNFYIIFRKGIVTP